MWKSDGSYTHEVGILKRTVRIHGVGRKRKKSGRLGWRVVIPSRSPGRAGLGGCSAVKEVGRCGASLPPTCMTSRSITAICPLIGRAFSSAPEPQRTDVDHWRHGWQAGSRGLTAASSCRPTTDAIPLFALSSQMPWRPTSVQFGSTGPDFQPPFAQWVTRTCISESRIATTWAPREREGRESGGMREERGSGRARGTRSRSFALVLPSTTRGPENESQWKLVTRELQR
jgi:hypothetical protein